MNTKITLWIVATTCAIGATTPRAVAQTQTVRFENIQDVVTDWNPNQHLYVHGDLGVGAPQLAELERWLDDHAPHWLIVLMQSADGQTYVSADGQRYRGMDAVEIALGPGLQNNTPIGRWTNPRSGETDAAVFVLYLRERKFSYFASDAQDRRGLGESHWIGELDQPAIRAMRGGGRIIDAVKDTVNNINSELEKQIDREIGQAERAARERARAVEECKDEIKLTRDQISNVITRRDDLRTQFPNAKGSLVTPPTDQWLASLETQQAELSDENVRERANAIDLIRDDVVRTLNDYADHAAWPTAVAAIQSRMNNLQNELDGFATDSIDVARQKLTEASNAHDNADPGFMDLYHDAAGKLDDAERLIAAERQRLASQAARHQLIVQSIIATLAVTLLAIMVVLFILNRRRRGAHDRAIDALDQRQKAVRAEMEHVLQLMQRSSEILGSREKVAERGYSGQTKKLCDETFDHVDDLLIMSGEVERVMDEATELIHPNDIAAKAVNMFSSARYEQGINRISGETLRFHRDRGLPQIVKDTTDSGEDPPEEVGLTFEQVFSSFRDHNKSASELLNTLETSLVEVNDRLRALRADIDALSETEQQLSKAHQHDGFFDIRNLFDTLIPSIEKDFDEADDVSATDPVRATQVFIPSATRKIRDALAINSVITLARNEIFPEFNKHAPRLRTLEYATEWIQTQVDSLGTTADTLVRDAAQRDIASDTSNLEASMRDLQARVQTSAALAEQLQTEFAPAIEALETDIAHTRDTVAQSLKIDAALALHEHDLDPDVSLGRARQQFAAAQAALHQGGTSAAADAVSAIQQALQSGRTIVADTAEALRTFDDTVRLRLKDYGDLRDQIPSHERQLESTRTQYATAALRLQAADAAYPDPRATLETHMIGTREHVTNIEELIERANRWGKQGRLLAASALLRQASLGTQEGKQLLNEMEKHIAMLDAQSSANSANLQRIDSRIQGIRPNVADRRTTSATIAYFEQLTLDITNAEQEVGSVARTRDPFLNAGQLGELAQRLDQLEALIAADRNAHAEATRAVSGAATQLQSAQHWIQQARNDGIPDSRTTTTCIQNILALENDLQQTRAGLDDPHGDWKHVDENAARINGQLGVEAARLRGDLQLAEQSMELLRRASQQVFQATRWTGSYGVNLPGSPGSGELERARRALQTGDYSMMMQLAQAAAMVAQQAVQQAEREVERKRREEERKAEEERRRRSRSMHTGGGNISFGGGGISMGGGGFSSGSRGSSGGSPSGSGFSRSGW